MLRSAVGKTHVLRSDLWWTIPFHILHWSFWDTIRISTDQVGLARHSGVQVPVISRHGVMWSFLPINIGTFQFLPTGLHVLCFGFCFAGPLPLRSLVHGPLLRVHFGESLVLDYTQISTLALKLSVSAIIYPRWTATINKTNSDSWCSPNNFFSIWPWPLTYELDL